MRSCPSPHHLVQRLRNLALTSPPETALFYARLWHAIYPPTAEDHESLHFLALCHIQVGNHYTAIGYVRDLVDPISDFADHKLVLGVRGSEGCMTCAIIVGRCCDALGRFGEGKEVLEKALRSCSPSCQFGFLSTNFTHTHDRPSRPHASYDLGHCAVDDGKFDT